MPTVYKADLRNCRNRVTLNIRGTHLQVTSIFLRVLTYDALMLISKT